MIYVQYCHVSYPELAPGSHQGTVKHETTNPMITVT